MLYNSDQSSTLPSTYYLLYNHLGSLQAVTDAQGNIFKELTYDSFGNIVKDITYDRSGNIIIGNDQYFPNLHVNLGFSGGLYDQETKLTRFGYRDYDAETGKWTAKDPIGFAGGDTNLYGYVLGDPVNFVDPLGLFMSGGTGAGAGFHLGIAGANVHVQLVFKSDGAYRVITICGRVGSGVYFGVGAEAGMAYTQDSDSECAKDTSSPLDALSLGFGGDLAFGSSGGGASAGGSTSGMSATGSGFVGSGLGASIGIEICYTREIKL